MIENISEGQMITDLNPTFLFTWKGTRKADEDKYHNHDFLELAFVMSGDGRYRIEDELYAVTEGDLIIFNPGVNHQALFMKEAEIPTTEFFVGFSDIQIEGYEKNFCPLPGGQMIYHTTGELRQKLFRIAAAMEAENALRNEGRYFMLKAYLMQMLIVVLREGITQGKPQPGCAFDSVNRKHVVEQIINYFEDHYARKISLDQIAENMYLSPFYISKIFKSEVGDTPIRHLINIRLEKARVLLIGGSSQSIQEIAASVGYDDAYHFSKLFKKRFGVSPSAYKQVNVTSAQPHPLP
jgi:AraC-like DNA-binding protein